MEEEEWYRDAERLFFLKKKAEKSHNSWFLTPGVEFHGWSWKKKGVQEEGDEYCGLIGGKPRSSLGGGFPF